MELRKLGEQASIVVQKPYLARFFQVHALTDAFTVGAYLVLLRLGLDLQNHLTHDLARGSRHLLTTGDAALHDAATLRYRHTAAVAH